MFVPVTLKDVRQALKSLENIKRPEADNEGDPLNSPLIYDYLSSEEQERVDVAVDLVRNYVKTPAGGPNIRSIKALYRIGFSTHFNQDQYAPYRYVGSLRIGDWTIDISDAAYEE